MNMSLLLLCGLLLAADSYGFAVLCIALGLYIETHIHLDLSISPTACMDFEGLCDSSLNAMSLSSICAYVVGKNEPQFKRKHVKLSDALCQHVCMYI